MTEREVDRHEIARASAAWLAFQETKDPAYLWAVDVKEEWFSDGDFGTMERFVLQVCHDADIASETQLGMIGAGPLEDLVEAHPERALELIEVEVKTNPVLLEALRSVWSRGQPTVRGRIDAILSRYGKGGAVP